MSSTSHHRRRIVHACALLVLAVTSRALAQDGLLPGPNWYTSSTMTSVTVSWKADPNAKSYTIEASAYKWFPADKTTQCATTQTTCTFGSLPPGTTIYIRGWTTFIYPFGTSRTTESQAYTLSPTPTPPMPPPPPAVAFVYQTSAQATAATVGFFRAQGACSYEFVLPNRSVVATNAQLGSSSIASFTIDGLVSSSRYTVHVVPYSTCPPNSRTAGRGTLVDVWTGDPSGAALAVPTNVTAVKGATSISGV